MSAYPDPTPAVPASAPQPPASYPETAEGVALCLLKIIVRAEGTPVEQLTEKSNAAVRGNRTLRAYILDTYVECLTAAKGDRGPVVGLDGRPLH